MNSKVSPTPGPWRIEKNKLYGNPMYLMDGNYAVAMLFEGYDAAEANWHLLAAAPELLQALQALEEIGSLINARQHANAPVRPDDWGELYHCCNQARAAIAKAQGGQP